MYKQSNVYYIERIPPLSDQMETPFALTKGFNRQLNFCVWVLRKDGLRVAPFDAHLDGDHSLRALGLNAEQWMRWVSRVAATQDRRLFPLPPIADPHHTEDLVAQELADLEVAIQQASEHGYLCSECEREILRRNRIKLVNYRVNGHLQALQHLPSGTSRSMTSTELWEGSLDLKEKLQELWSEYQHDSEFSGRGFDASNAVVTNDESQLQQRLKAEETQQHLPALDLCLVSYPTYRSLFCPLTVVIAGIPTENPAVDHYRSNLLETIKGHLQA